MVISFENPSLDRIYLKLDKQILLTQSFTGNKYLSFIIKSCRLKPHTYVFEKKDNKLTLHKWWFDEFGNSFKIMKNKKIKLIYNDVSLNLDKIICTDLYYGLSIDKIAKISKLAFICAGKDEDLYQDYYFLVFLGIDNYLRAYLSLYGEWQRVSPLLLGMDNLEFISQNLDIKYFQEFSNEKNILIPCISKQQWLTSLPLPYEFIKIINKNYDKLSEIFK